MKPLSKIFLCSLIILPYCFASHCFAQTPGKATNALPQFKMWTGDIGTHQFGGVLSPSSTQTNYTARFVLDFRQHRELRKFTQEHLHQRVQFVLEGRIVGELYLTNEIANGVVDLPAKSREEAEEMVKGFTHA